MAYWEINKQWGLPEKLLVQLEPVKRAVYKNHVDFMACFVGPEGSGKTTLETRVANYLMDGRLNIKTDFYWSALDCVDGWLRLPIPEPGGKHYAVVLDEAIMGLDALRWQSGDSRIFNAVAATIRYKYTMSFLSIPRLFLLNNRVREGRLGMLAHVYGSIDRDGNVVKGFFNLYNARQIQDIYKDPKTHRVVYPDTQYQGMPFLSLEGDPLWDEYKAREKIEKQKQNELLSKMTHFEQRKSLKRMGEKPGAVLDADFKRQLEEASTEMG